MAQNCNYEVLCLFYVHVYIRLQISICLSDPESTHTSCVGLTNRRCVGKTVRPSVISETLALGRCLTDVFPTPIPNKPPSAPHTTSFHLCAQCVCILFLWGHRGVWQCSSHAAKCEKCDWPTFGYYGYQRPYIAEWRVWKLAKNRSLILTHEEGRRSWCVYTLNYILDDGLKHHDSFPLFLYHL